MTRDNATLSSKIIHHINELATLVLTRFHIGTHTISDVSHNTSVVLGFSADAQYDLAFGTKYYKRLFRKDTEVSQRFAVQTG
jgi:hypothetical protein